MIQHNYLKIAFKKPKINKIERKFRVTIQLVRPHSMLEKIRCTNISFDILKRVIDSFPCMPPSLFSLECNVPFLIMADIVIVPLKKKDLVVWLFI